MNIPYSKLPKSQALSKPFQFDPIFIRFPDSQTDSDKNQYVFFWGMIALVASNTWFIDWNVANPLNGAFTHHRALQRLNQVGLGCSSLRRSIYVVYLEFLERIEVVSKWMEVHKVYVGAVPRVVTWWFVCLWRLVFGFPSWWHDFYPRFDPDPGKAAGFNFNFFYPNKHERIGPKTFNIYPNQPWGPSISCCEYIHLSYIAQWINDVEHSMTADCAYCQGRVWWTRHINDSTNWQQLDSARQRQQLVILPLLHRWIVLEDLGEISGLVCFLIIPSLESPARVFSRLA